MWNVKQPAIAVLLFALSIVGHAFSASDGFASIVNPLVGVAVAFVAVHGWSTLVPATIAIFLGCLMRLSWLPDQFDPINTITCLIVLTAITIIHIVLVACLIRWTIGIEDDLFLESRFIKLVLISAATPALINASISAIFLRSFGIVIHSIGLEWAICFAGDLLGVAIFFPLAHMVIKNWNQIADLRIFAVSFPVLIVFAAFVISLRFIGFYERNEFETEFYDQTDKLHDSIVEKLSTNTQMLYAVAGLFESSNEVTRTDFQIFASSILVRHSGVKAILWMPVVASKEQQALISAARKHGAKAQSERSRIALNSFSIKNWSEEQQDWVAQVGTESATVCPTFYVEPMRKNEDLLGLNWMSLPLVEGVLFDAAKSEELESTGPLIDVVGDKSQPAYLVAIKVGRISVRKLDTLGIQIPEGYVAGLFTFSAMLPLKEIETASEEVALIAKDITTQEPIDLVEFGESAYGVNNARAEYQRKYVYHMAGRRLQFVFRPTNQSLNRIHGPLSIITVCVGSAIIVLLQFVLLLVTGRTQTIEKVVLERTAQLKSEISERERTQNELEKKAYALERSNLELDRFAYIASHDLKAPLRAIDQLSQWIFEDVGDQAKSQTKRHVELMQNRVRRLEKLLDDLLEYARVKIDVHQLEMVDLNTVVDEIKFLLGAPVEFEFVISDPLPTFQTEKTAIEICFRNLISNAVKHHDKSCGVIMIGGIDAGDFFEFYVGDDGPGIEPEYRKQVFEIFRTLKSRDQVEGSGMGLTLVKKIVDSVNGKIWIDDQDLDGTTFRFLWPKKIVVTDNRHLPIGKKNQIPPSSVAR